jgi:hypothetical protein
MPSSPAVYHGYSDEAEPRDAVFHVREQIAKDDLALVLFFAAPAYDREALAQALAMEFPNTEVIGCTTAGEITSDGYREGTFTAIGFSSKHFTIRASLISALQDFRMEAGETLVRETLEGLGLGLPSARSWPTQTFAMLLVDGMSKQEEVVVSSLNRFLDPVPLFGGSAGDGLSFGKTWIYANGAFHDDAAILAVFQTSCPFKVFKLDHFHPTDRKMVVTEADPNARLVKEINAEPAAPAYARMVGLDAQELSPLIFAAYPVVVRIGGEYHVRSIQKVERDGSLRFYCGIEEGLVLTVAKGEDLAANLTKNLEKIEGQLGETQMILGFDCILRRLEAEQRQQTREVSDVMRKHKVVGFCTYGEQFHSMHVNQTFTGVAIGAPRARHSGLAAE